MKNKIFFYSLSLVVLSSCSFSAKKNNEYYEGSYEQVEKYKTQINEAEKLLESQKFVEAESRFDRFIVENPNTIYTLGAKLGLGKALAGQGKWAEALRKYRDLKEQTIGRQDQIFALTSYYSSFAYEALAQDEKVYTSLTDAQRFQNLLPKEISEAEIPARLANYYQKSGDFKEANVQLQKAEKAISILFADPKYKSIKAKSFFQMGSVSTQQLSYENLLSSIQTMSILQVFLVKAIESNDSAWSYSAIKLIKKNYEAIWDTIDSIPLNKAMDKVAAEKEQTELQIKAMGELLKCIQNLRLKQSPFTEQTIRENNFIRELNEFIDQIENEVQVELLNLNSNTPLTPEAKKLNRLKVDFTIKSTPVFKNEKFEKKEEELIKKDPNL